MTLTLGANFAGVNPPPTPTPAKSGKPGGVSATAGQTNPASIQTRNAAASICSGLPPANPGG